MKVAILLFFLSLAQAGEKPAQLWNINVKLIAHGRPTTQVWKGFPARVTTTKGRGPASERKLVSGYWEYLRDRVALLSIAPKKSRAPKGCVAVVEIESQFGVRKFCSAEFERSPELHTLLGDLNRLVR